MAKICRRVRPALGPTRADEHSRTRRDTAMSRLEREHIRRRYAVVAVHGGLFADIDDDGGPDQSLERHALRRFAATREVNRRIEMRAPVLRRTKRVGRVKEPAGRVAEMQAF